MNEETESLEKLVARVDNLVEQECWDELAALDDSARDLVQAATTRARETEADSEEVRRLVERLLSLYDRARSSAEAERDEAERELRETSRTQRAARAYLDNQ